MISIATIQPVDLAVTHEGQYKYPSCVAYCQPFLQGEPRGYPYANKRYREVAEAFAEQTGQRIEDWNDGGWFTLGGKSYQVGADVICIDVMSR